MDMETAAQARKILNRIEYLTDLYDKISKSIVSTMWFVSDDSKNTVTITYEKGGENGEMVRYILDGIVRNIQDLEEGLKDL